MLIMKDGKVGPAHLKIVPSPSYTLVEIEQLIQKYVVEVSEPNSMVDWRMSDLILWLRRQAKEQSPNEPDER